MLHSQSEPRTEERRAYRIPDFCWRYRHQQPEEEKVPIGLPLPDMTMDQFIDIEDGWLMREDRV